MYRLHITTCLALLLTAASAWAQAPQEPTPVHTSRSRFRIPYRYDAAEMARLRATEIRLYTSVDGGRRWQMTHTVAPDAQRFEFQAPRDGEYWFSVRTVDGNNHLHPGGDTIHPGLIVVVDSVNPVLKIDVRQPESGKVELSWSAVDANLNLDSLLLEFVSPGGREWEPVRIVPKAGGATSWSVPSGGIVAVRGTVKDYAGNEATAQMQLSVDPTNAGVPRPVRPDFRKPIAETPALGNDTLANSFPGRMQPESNPWQNDSPVEPTPTRQLPFPAEQPVADRSTERPDTLQGRYTESNPKPFKPSGTVRMVRATEFSLGYQLEDVGPSGVSKVELFITQDDGAHWWRYGDDEDRTSPVDVEVPLEGVYGFALRVQSGAGLALDPPQNGDKPDVSVIVDETPPETKLLGVRTAAGDEGTRVIVRWSISEEYPNGAPVSVSYSVNADGPWVPITGWQPDTGEFAWKVTPQTPPHVFIRVDARDASGNVSSAISENSIAIDLSRPSARIVDVEPESGNEYRE
jgi:hypothetical protein